MLIALARLLAALVRLTAIVALAVMAGVAVALASRNMNGDVLEIVALFATFAVPVVVAWFLFRAIPPLSSEATDPPDVRVLDNGNEANNEQPQGPAAEVDTGTQLLSERKSRNTDAGG